MLSYIDFKNKNCKNASKAKADKLYRMYVESSIVSTDFIQKEPMTPQDIFIQFGTTNCTSFAPFPTMQVQATPCTVPCNNNGNKTMYVENDKHVESSRINYLNQRVSSVAMTKEYELRKTFNLDDDTAPQTAEEIVARIQAGKFTLDPETQKKKNYEPIRFIKWRDPAVKADEDGFRAAIKAVETTAQNARDVIAGMPYVDGLAALKELEAWTLPPSPITSN